MIHEEICTYEVCKLAKEKGFNERTRYFYETNCVNPKAIEHCCGSDYFNKYPKAVAAPTQSLLQRWLRGEKRVVFGISPMQEMDCDYLGWCATIYKVDENGYGLSWQEELYYDTYELALEHALKYALEKLV